MRRRCCDSHKLSVSTPISRPPSSSSFQYSCSPPPTARESFPSVRPALPLPLLPTVSVPLQPASPSSSHPFFLNVHLSPALRPPRPKLISLSFCPPPQRHPRLRAISSLIADIISGSPIVLLDDIYHPVPPSRLCPLAAPHLFCSLAASLFHFIIYPPFQWLHFIMNPLARISFQINQTLSRFPFNVIKCQR